jgi:hypothetical protein
MSHPVSPPFTTRLIIATLLVAVVILAMVAGYYHAKYTDLLKLRSTTSFERTQLLLG